MKPGRPLRRFKPLARSGGPGIPQGVRQAGRRPRSPVYDDVDRRDRGACRARPLIRAVTTGMPERCWGRADVHHLLPRSQGGRDELDNLITLCRAHHSWVHDHPAAAVGLGLLRRRYDA